MLEFKLNDYQYSVLSHNETVPPEFYLGNKYEIQDSVFWPNIKIESEIVYFLTRGAIYSPLLNETLEINQVTKILLHPETIIPLDTNLDEYKAFTSELLHVHFTLIQWSVLMYSYTDPKYRNFPLSVLSLGTIYRLSESLGHF